MPSLFVISYTTYRILSNKRPGAYNFFLKIRGALIEIAFYNKGIKATVFFMAAK